MCFTGRVLLSHVNIGGVNFPVSPFRERVTQCSKCWHFGHHEKSCTRPQRLCKTCAGIHDENDCTNNIKCVNCSGRHLSSSADCPVLKRLKKSKLDKANNTRPQVILFSHDQSRNLQKYNYTLNSTDFLALGAFVRSNTFDIFKGS